MVEIHLVRLKVAAAVGARDLAPLAQHLRGSDLASPHPENFLLPVSSVVVHICWALVPNSRHGSFLEQPFATHARSRLMRVANDPSGGRLKRLE